MLLTIEVGAEVCYDNLVDSFGLSIGLGVRGRGHPGADSYDGQKILPGVGRELGVTIGHNVSGKAVEVPNLSGKYPGKIFSGFLIILQGYEVSHLRVSVDNYPQLSADIQSG